MTVFNLELCVSQVNYCSRTISRCNDTNPTDEHEAENEVPCEETQDTVAATKNQTENTVQPEEMGDTENTDFETVNPSSKRKCVGPSRDKNLTIINEIRKGRVERTALLLELTKKPQVIPLEEKYDPAISMFFKSVVATVSAFSPILKAKVKAEIMNVISRYEIENATEISAVSAPVQRPC